VHEFFSYFGKPPPTISGQGPDIEVIVVIVIFVKGKSRPNFGLFFPYLGNATGANV